jgi:GTP-binding protein
MMLATLAPPVAATLTCANMNEFILSEYRVTRDAAALQEVSGFGRRAFLVTKVWAVTPHLIPVDVWPVERGLDPSALSSGAMSVPLPLRFLRSASAHTQLDESVTEIAMIGRSNVGKSSLINAIANRNKLAKTSKTPGATQLINIYEFGDEDSDRWLVDLPGYGFAKLSKNRQKQMAAMINDYVLEREPLTHAVVLIDANVGPTSLDLQTIDWLRDIDLDFVVVGTKIDKIKSGDRSKKQKKAAGKLQMASGDICWVSAEKGTGIPELRSVLANLLSS